MTNLQKNKDLENMIARVLSEGLEGLVLKDYQVYISIFSEDIVSRHV
jgi:hypothetical protein